MCNAQSLHDNLHRSLWQVIRTFNSYIQYRSEWIHLYII